MVRLLAERSDNKSNVKLGGFRPQPQASYVSSHTEKLWYNETVCLWMTIYIYIYIYIWEGERERWKSISMSARGVMVTVVGSGHSDMSSNPGKD